VRHARGIADSAWARISDHAVVDLDNRQIMTRFVAGNCVQLLRTAAEYFPALEAACDGGRTRDLSRNVYLFRRCYGTAHRWCTVARWPRAASLVHVVIDGFWIKGPECGTFCSACAEAAFECSRFARKSHLGRWRRERLRRPVHRKISVFDAKIAFVGGINIIDDMNTPRQIPPRFDYAVRIEGPLLADIYR
jgi:cardiolipin synthase